MKNVRQANTEQRSFFHLLISRTGLIQQGTENRNHNSASQMLLIPFSFPLASLGSILHECVCVQCVCEVVAEGRGDPKSTASQLLSIPIGGNVSEAPPTPAAWPAEQTPLRSGACRSMPSDAPPHTLFPHTLCMFLHHIWHRIQLFYIYIYISFIFGWADLQSVNTLCWK